MPHIKIKSLKINENEYECGGINIIVGPNNSGKTTLLNELENCILHNEVLSDFKRISDIRIVLSEAERIIEEEISCLEGYDKWIDIPLIDQTQLSKVYNVEFNERWFNRLKEIQKPEFQRDLPHEYSIVDSAVSDDHRRFYKFILKVKTLFETCETRLSDNFEFKLQTIEDEISNLTHYLFLNEAVAAKISEHIQAVFGKTLLFDDLPIGVHGLRITDQKDFNIDNTISLGEKHTIRNRMAPLLKNQGHGIRAYCKIAMALIATNRNIILIDEPEAFLHPPQRRGLGNFIATHVAAGRQVFIATHDSEFLRGVLLNTRADIKLFFLKQHNELHYSNFNDAPFSQSLTYNTQILNGYFTKITIFVESEVDRLIYQLVVEKFFPKHSENINFVGLNGDASVIKTKKETVRSLNLKCVGIVDCDYLLLCKMLGDSGISREDMRKIKKYSDYYRQLTLPQQKELRKRIKKKGYCCLEQSHSEWIKVAIETLRSYGIYVIENGEIESFFSSAGGKAESSFNVIRSIIDSYSLRGNPRIKQFLKKIIDDM